MNNVLMLIILLIGWPVLLIMTMLIIKRGIDFYHELEGKLIGRLIVPTIFGWLFGMYALGIVSTAYMVGINWTYTVLPMFFFFMVAIVIIYRAISKWQNEAKELHIFYESLEGLVKKRTKELEKQHALAIRHEKEIQKLKDQFVFIAAHELKTPVTAIRWGIESALQEGKNKLDPQVVDYLQSVQSSNKRLITLVDDLLNVARIEAGVIKVNIIDCDAKKICTQLLDEMTGYFKEKRVTVINEIKKKIIIRADEDRFKQVLINVLSNAAKYNKINGKILINSSASKKFATFSIADTGIGMTEAEQKKLFQKFYRVQKKETKDIEGTGLGLYVTKEIVTKLKGKIHVESKAGEGSTFSISLPLSKK